MSFMKVMQMITFLILNSLKKSCQQFSEDSMKLKVDFIS